MSEWGPLLDDLARRHAAAREMGGAERVAELHARGRLDARQRVQHLLDAGSFVELGALVGSVQRGVTPSAPADGLVAGHGTIDGRPVLVGAEDFTVMGGSIGIGTHAKRVRLAQLAAQERVSLVLLLHGAGERAQNAFERYPYAPNDLQALARLAGRVPTVAVVMGPSAGHSALTAPLMDFVVMVEGAALFTAGPPLVAAATGEEVDASELGGTAIHTGLSGVAHNAAPDDRTALDLVRRYLAYFAPRDAPTDAREPDPPAEGRRRLDAVLDIVPADPRRPYDVRAVIEELADRASTLELAPAFGRTVVTTLARVGGTAVGVVANQPAVRAGAIDVDGARKATRFVELVSRSGLPLVFLADNPGVQVGSAAERAGVLRAAAELFAAQARARSPKIHVTLRKAYGFGSSLMAMNPFDHQTVTLALPGARLGAMPAESGAEAARLDLDAAALLEHAELGGATAAADTLSYDAVIDPRDLRDALLDALRLAGGRTRRRRRDGARRSG